MKKFPVSYEYQIGGSLPADASSQVMRQADLDFYESLKAISGKQLSAWQEISMADLVERAAGILVTSAAV